MGKALPRKLRARWDAVMETEGKAIGLSECRPFLENKTVNDIFYEGKYKGRDCIVKCSSKAPDSILNEFALAGRVHAADPSVTPEPQACRMTEDGRMAFIVTAKATGPSLTEFLGTGLSGKAADSLASDILRLADALKKTGVVHRDLFSDNLLMDVDGHFKAIDFQFAVDRDDYRECGWMRKNPKYLYAVFGVNRDFAPGVWNDFPALCALLDRCGRTPHVAAAVERLKSEADGMTVENRPAGWVRMKLKLYAVSLKIQRFVHAARPGKAGRLKRRIEALEGL